MREIQMHWQKRRYQKSDERGSQRKQESHTQIDQNKMTNAEECPQPAQGKNRHWVVNRESTCRKACRRNQIIEGWLIHFPAFSRQRQRPVLLNVADIVEMLLRIEASVERQQPSIVPEKKKQQG